MNVFLVHHADAVGPDVDAGRPLSGRGRAQAGWLADEARKAGATPQAIWHSGKLRARQTAEAMLAACNPFARMQMVRGLRPDDPAEWIVDLLEGEDVDVMLVGHFSSLPRLAARLGAREESFPVHGLMWLERTGAKRYEERLRLQPPAEVLGC